MAIQYFWRHPLAEQVREEGRQAGREEGRQEGREEGREEGLRQGRVEAMAAMIVPFLESRGIPVPADVRERVETSRDLGELETWLQRAAHVTRATDLFAAE